jgi:hypothetical protein
MILRPLLHFCANTDSSGRLSLVTSSTLLLEVWVGRHSLKWQFLPMERVGSYMSVRPP